MSKQISHEELMRFLDGEATPEQRTAVEKSLAQSSELRREFAIFRAMKEELQELSFSSGQDGSVWGRIQRRITMPVGWLLVSVGVAVWLGYGAWVLATAPGAVLPRLATGAVAIGVLVLLAHVIWERYQQYESDPYRDVYR